MLRIVSSSSSGKATFSSKRGESHLWIWPLGVECALVGSETSDLS
uniref:Uncharacterized protein n=1 Tax=Rhizophora mucronata TaxID=61149 RepID=A0A2P2IXF6_RHIMU